MDLLLVVAAAAAVWLVVVVQVVLRVVGSMLPVQAALPVVVLSEVPDLDLDLELRWEEEEVVGGAISPLSSIFSLSSLTVPLRN